jgi:hypothetical protein
VNVSKGSSDGEHVSNLAESLVDIPDLLGRRVELFGVSIFVIDSIFLSTGNSDLHLEPDLHLDEFLEVLAANGNVFLVRFFRKIQHVRRVERFTVLFKVSFVGSNHTIEPRQKLLGTVITVQDDGNAIIGSHGTNMQGHGDRTGSTSVGIRDGLAGKELTSTVADLNHDG